MKNFALLCAVIAVCLCSIAARAQQPDFSKVEIKVTKVAGSVYMLEGAGGNIGVSVGTDGILIVDDQFAPLADKIRAALILSASGAYWSSTINNPSGPTETPILPPAPSSIQMLPATCVAFISTLEKSCCAGAQGASVQTRNRVNVSLSRMSISWKCAIGRAA